MIAVELVSGQSLELGNQREKNIRQFSFDVSAWESEYPGIVCFLTIEDRRGVTRPAGQTHTNGSLTWIVMDDTTIEAGEKSICVRGVMDGLEKHSALFRGYVSASHGEPNEAPEPTASWISELTIAEAERKSAEIARGTAETGRATAETQRGEAEIQRDTAEIERAESEEARKQAEQEREQHATQAINSTNAAAEAANTSAANADEKAAAANTAAGAANTAAAGVGAAIAPAYSAAATYAIGDICTYLGTRYKCTTAITVAEAWTVGHWTAESVQTELDAHTSQLAETAEKIVQIDGNIELPQFEKNMVYINSGVLTYVNNANKIRTPSGVTIPLKAGDVLTSKFWKDFKFRGGYKNADTTWTDIGWSTDAYIAPIDSEYVFTFSYFDDRTVSDLDELASSFSIIRPSTSIGGGRYLTPFDMFSVKSVNHRGASNVAPENTIPAFKQSVALGFPIIETDVRFTSDNVPVLLHDATIDRTSDGTGAIASMTLEAAKTYDFGSWFSADFTGTTIPTLDEAVKCWRALNLKVYLEISFDATYEQISAVYDVVKKYDFEKSVTWVSFRAPVLSAVRGLSQTARMGLNVETINATAVRYCRTLKTNFNDVFINANITGLTDSAITLAQAANFPVEVWLIETASAMVALNPYITGVASNSVVFADALKAAQ